MENLNHYLPTFERRLRSLEGRSEITIQSYHNKVEEFLQWLVPEHGRRSPDNGQHLPTRQDVEGFLEYCFYRGNKNSTRLTKLIALRKFFTHLAYEGIIKEDITVNIPRPRANTGGVQKFMKKEIIKLFTAIDIAIEAGIRDVVIFILAAFCGLRIGEIVRLNLGDVMDDESEMDINIVNTKHGSNRVVYLWKAPADFIRQWLAIRVGQGASIKDPLLVSYRKGDTPTRHRLTPVGVTKKLGMYANKAGIKKPAVNMHMFRATHASDLRHVKGYDVFAIAERLGHRNISTTEIYIPSRGRVHREYPSLAAYWREFNHAWDDKD